MAVTDYFYFALPSELTVDLNNPSSISTGSSDVAQSFTLVGLAIYDTSFTDTENNAVTFAVNLYRTFIPGAFTANTTLTITPT